MIFLAIILIYFQVFRRLHKNSTKGFKNAPAMNASTSTTPISSARISTVPLSTSITNLRLSIHQPTNPKPNQNPHQTPLQIPLSKNPFSGGLSRVNTRQKLQISLWSDFFTQPKVKRGVEFEHWLKCFRRGLSLRVFAVLLAFKVVLRNFY